MINNKKIKIYFVGIGGIGMSGIAELMHEIGYTVLGSDEIESENVKNVTDILEKNSVHFDELGIVNENELIVNDKSKVTIDELTKSHTNWLTNYMKK